MQTDASPLAQLRRQPAFEHADAEARLSRERAYAHKQRCRRLPPVDAAEAVRLVAQFLASGAGTVTLCPPAYAAPVAG